ncbi:MAG: hypothetical protein DYH05_03220 [Acidobacteria bacterium ACB1]|nr:hypothetical protein [Pyrinomonadaceae bacterium]MCE7961490.1 hypothetical protein [Acidobacteria bacterium ACB1]RIJ95560.1 MAG: hypothetical protein DCC44_02060 [Acidobacteriota bacterium]
MRVEQESLAVGKPRASTSIVIGGIVVGFLDFLDASIFFPLYYGIGFTDVWHGPASGLIGRDAARAGGWDTALLGILLHFLVALCIAAVYYGASRLIPYMVRYPVRSGIVFGVAANFVMQYVVIPLSAIGKVPAWPPLGHFLNNVIGHALLVGLPLALIVRYSAGQNGPSER